MSLAGSPLASSIENLDVTETVAKRARQSASAILERVARLQRRHMWLARVRHSVGETGATVFVIYGCYSLESGRQSTSGDAKLNVMTKFLDRLEIGEPVISGPSFMFPLFSDSETNDEPLPMSEALDLNLVEFGETSLAGNVPEIVVENRSARPVFLLDGEQLLGLKQNRTFNLSMLIPGGSKIPIPVSCLEGGRWTVDSARAFAAEHVHFASGRANKLRSVTESLRRAGSYRSDQSKVWSDISRIFQKSGERSETAAEADFYATRRDRLDCLISSLAARPRQIGAAVGVAGQLVGIDLFLTPKLYASLHDKLLKSYLLDALDLGLTSAPPGRDIVFATIRGLFAGQPERFPSPGAGEAFRWSGEHGSAAALVYDGKCVHAVGFCTDSESAQEDFDVEVA